MASPAPPMESLPSTSTGLPSRLASTHLDRLKADLADEVDSTGYHPSASEDDDIFHSDSGTSSRQHSIKLKNALASQHLSQSRVSLASSNFDATSYVSHTKASPSPSLILSPAPSNSGAQTSSNWPSGQHSGSRSASASRSAFQPLQSKTSLYRRQASGSSTPSYDYVDEAHPPTSAGGAAGGGSSLSRAKSISSVSSVNSTSSMEAAPFRAAPLGNFRVGFGGFMNTAQLQHDRFNASTPVSPEAHSRAMALQGDNSQLTNTGVQAADESVPNAAKAKFMPKAPTNEWQYRNAPGLPRLRSDASGEPVESLQELSRVNESFDVNDMTQIGAQRPRPSIRSKLVKRAGKLGLKPLTTVSVADVNQVIGDSQGDQSVQYQTSPDFSLRGKSLLAPSGSSHFSLLNLETGDVTRPTSSVTNAPLIVPKNPPGPPFSGPPPSPGLVGPSQGALPILPLAKVSPQEQGVSIGRSIAGESNPFDVLVTAESNPKSSLDVSSTAKHTSIGSGLSTVLGVVLGSNRNSSSSLTRPASVASQNSRSSPSLTPAQIIQFEARAGTATVPSEPSGASPGPEADKISLPPTDMSSTARRPTKSVASRTAVGTKSNSSPNKTQRPGLLRAITSESIGRKSQNSKSSDSPKEESVEKLSSRRGSTAMQAQSQASPSPSPLTVDIPKLESVTGDMSLTSNSSSASKTILAGGNALSARSDMPSEGNHSMTLASQHPTIHSEVSRNGAASSSSVQNPPSKLPTVTTAQLTPVAERSRGASSLSTNRTARTRNDFYFGDTIGEGSYSTVVEAWDILPLREKGISIPVQSQSGANNAMEAIAGKKVRKLSAEHMQSAKVYAVKVLDKIHILKEKKQKYVNVEKEALSMLTRHPGVITLYWTFQDRDSLYFVLELAPNGELLSSIKKLGSFSEACARYYAAQLLDTIEAMHRVGVLHRDLKPENVLLDLEMRTRITDFGSAKIVKADDSKAEDATQRKRSSSFVGTAEYVSPELLTDKQVSEASDYWAFGCIIYQMIAGRPPFKGASEYQTFQKIMNRDFEFQDEFPSTAKDLVEKLFNLDPDKRPKGTEIRAHAFFDDVDWSTLWTEKAPALSAGLYERPAMAQRDSAATVSLGTSRGSVGDGIESESMEEGKRDQDSAMSPSDQAQNDVGDYADDDESSVSDAQPQMSFRKRGFSAGASTAERMLSQIGSGTKKSGGNLLNKVAAGIASLDKSEGSSSNTRLNRIATTSTTAGRSNRNANALDVDEIIASATASWAALLLPQESLLYACPVLHKTNTSLLRSSNKKRQLLLTDFPRLLCVKETNDQLKVKSEVLLGIPKVLLTPVDRRQLFIRRESVATQNSGASSEDEEMQGNTVVPMHRQSSAGPLVAYNGQEPAKRNSISAVNGSRGGSFEEQPAVEGDLARPNSTTIDVTQMSPNVMTSVESKSARVFIVQTPARSYQYEDPLGGATQWVKRINAAARQHAATMDSA